ncbi:MAG: hypothetical protein M3N53_13155 [Actinomycetota bacterium]|nr:hypothetical protein [Actinomycetota bacterium]
MAVIGETRYGGIYEGGPWAAFDVSATGADPLEGGEHVVVPGFSAWHTQPAVPQEAFGGDSFAIEWWMAGPSVLVGVGDDATQALSHLEHLRRQAEEGVEKVRRYATGLRVGIAGCAHDSMRADDWSPIRMSAIVRDARLEPNTSRFGSALPAQWIYLVEFDDALTSEVPEPFLRFDISEWPGHFTLT